MRNASSILTRIQQSWLALFVVAAVLLSFSSFEKIAEQLKQPIKIDLNYLLLASFLQLLFWLVLTLAWRRVVQVWSQIEVPRTTAFLQTMMVNLGKYFPGKIWGMVARGVHLSSHGIDQSAVITATLHEQLLLLHSGVILSAVFAATVYPSNLTLLLAAATVASAFVGERLGRLVFTYLRVLLEKLGRNAEDVHNLRAPAVRYLSLVSRYVCLWIISGIILVALHLSCISPSLDARTFDALMLANAVGILAGFIAIFAPAGIGVREVITIAVLTSVMSTADAVALSLVSRLWFVATDLLGGGVAFWLSAGKTAPAR